MNTLYLRGVCLDKGAIRQDDYLLDLPVVKHMTELAFEAPVTFFVGENGSGKSTLLEAIAVCWGFNPEGGSIHFRFSTNDTHSALSGAIHLIKGPLAPRTGYFLRAESFYNLATHLEELDAIPACAPPLADAYGGKSLHKQSHGESFLALALNRFGPEGFYLLDEPEAALSSSRQLTLLARIHELAGLGCQFLIATHSPILLSLPGAEILELGEKGLARVDYEECMPYRVTKNFLDDPRRTLRYLLDQEPQ